MSLWSAILYLLFYKRACKAFDSFAELALGLIFRPATSADVVACNVGAKSTACATAWSHYTERTVAVGAAASYPVQGCSKSI